MTRELTNLLALRTEAMRGFRTAFKAQDWTAIEEFRAEIHALQQRIAATR